MITHDPTTSQDLEWREDAVNDVILRALRYLGVNLSDVEVSTFAGQKQLKEHDYCRSNNGTDFPIACGR